MAITLGAVLCLLFCCNGQSPYGRTAVRERRQPRDAALPLLLELSIPQYPSEIMETGPGLYLVEHINLVVQDPEKAEEFYQKLGCSRDMRRKPSQALHMNCGALTQFHLPTATDEEPPQRSSSLHCL